jgi:hypothetical protein
MDVTAFSSELLSALAEADFVERVALRVEGNIVDGRAYLCGEMFLEFYFNEVSGTIAFALIKGRERIWGIDRDNIRRWHLHPVEEPESHVAIEPLSVPEIVERLKETLKELEGGLG